MCLSAYQSKLKGRAPLPRVDANTFLNSSKSIDPDPSLRDGSVETLQSTSASDLHVEKLEGNQIIGVRPLQKCLKDCEIVPRNQIMVGLISHFEEYRELIATNFCKVFAGGNRVDKGLSVQETKKIKDQRRVIMSVLLALTECGYSQLSVDLFRMRLESTSPFPRFTFWTSYCFLYG